LVLVIAYNHEIIALVYERGAFTAKSTTMTSAAFLFYSFGVVGYACQEIFNRFYYALKKFRVPMLASMACLVLKVVLDLLLYKTVGIVGISASTAVCLLVYALIMSTLASREIGGLAGSGLLAFALRMLPALLVMLGIILGFKVLGPGQGLISGFLLPLGLSGCAYLGVARLTKIDRVFYLKEDAKP
jgi:putative peptidoglycan lipid II flippase